MMDPTLPHLGMKARIDLLMKLRLTPQRHARAEKLLNEGRLQIMLNDNGEIENSAESPPRLPAFPPDHHRKRKNKSQRSRRSQTKRSNKTEKKHMNGGHQMKGSTGKKRRKISEGRIALYFMFDRAGPRRFLKHKSGLVLFFSSNGV